MNLEFDDDTEYLIGQASEVFSKAAPVDRFRSQAPCWETLVEAGWGTLGEAFMADEIGLPALVGVARAAGRHLLIEQFVTAGFVVPALLHGASGAEVEELAGRMSTRPALLLGDGREADFPVGEFTAGECFGADGTEFEILRLVAGATADHIDLEFLDGGQVTVRRTAGLSFSVASVGVEGGRWRSFSLAIDRTQLHRLRAAERLVHSAALLGCSEEMLRIGRDYTMERVQFGVPIAGFQAVKHGFADVLAANEVAWAAVLCACAEGLDAALRIDVARILCLHAVDLSATASAQFFGGIGFTWESDLHFYLKAALDGRARFGSRDELAASIARKFQEQTC